MAGRLLVVLTVLAAAGSDGGAFPGPIMSAHTTSCARESVWMCEGRAERPWSVLTLRGGRVKGMRREDAGFAVDNEKLALEYMSIIRNKGLSTSLDLNSPDEDREEGIGVPQQVKVCASAV